MSFDEWLCFGIPEQIVNEASDWIAILDSKSVTIEQQQTFFIWLDEKPEHRWAFEELSEAWAKTSLLSGLESQLEQSQVLEFPHREKLVLATNSAFQKAETETHITPNNSPLWFSNLASYASLLLIVLGIFSIF